MKSWTIVALALAIAAPVFADVNPANPTQTKKGVEEPSSTPLAGLPVVQGCYSSAGNLIEAFNSVEHIMRDVNNG